MTSILAFHFSRLSLSLDELGNLAIVKVWSLMEFDEEESKQMMAGVGTSYL